MPERPEHILYREVRDVLAVLQGLAAEAIVIIFPPAERPRMIRQFDTGLRDFARDMGEIYDRTGTIEGLLQ